MKIVLVFFLTLKCVVVNTQEFTILDKTTYEPVPYVGVQLLGSNNGVYSNHQGKFVVEPLTDSIQITHIGYFPLKLKVSEISNIIFLMPKSELLEEVVLNSKAYEKTIGYIRKSKTLTWTLNEKTALTTLLKYEKPINNSYIKKIYIPIGKGRIKLIGDKATESYPNFSSAFRVHLYSNKNNEPAENLLKNPIIIKCNQDSEDIIEVDIENEFIAYPEEGVFIGVEMIGSLSENGNVIEEKSKGSVLPSFKFTKKNKKDLNSVSYTKAIFLGKDWVKIDKNDERFAHLSNYNMAVSLTLDVYEE